MQKVKKLNWDKIIAEYHQSGLTQAAFARRTGISSGSLSERIRGRASKTVNNGNSPTISKFISLNNVDKIELEVGGLFKVYLSEKQLVTIIRSLRD